MDLYLLRIDTRTLQKVNAQRLRNIVVIVISSEVERFKFVPDQSRVLIIGARGERVVP